jgi:RND superfamily putative drug exporter
VPKGENQSTIIPPLERFVEERVEPPVSSHFSGLSPLGRDINEATVDSIHTAELIAFPVLIIVLLLVFRSPIAAGIPLVIALGTTQAGFGVVSIITEFAKLDAIALSLASMIGLALGVDYSLLIVTRFREALADRQSPRGAASLAANTAGRTAVFAGAVLIGIMLVTFFLSPGTVLLSSAVGAMVVTVLSMIGAALVTPAAVRLLGHRVNMWQIGASTAGEEEGGGAIGRIVRRVAHRPALATTIVMVLLLVLAAPVLALDTIPPDPRQLPEGSKGLEDFKQVRRAGFGPIVDVVVSAPRGAVTDPERLEQIERLEKRLERVPLVRTVVGPGLVGEQTKDLRDAPRKIRKGKRQIAKGEQDLTRLAGGLRNAAGGVGELREGLVLAALGAQRLVSGTERARLGSDRLAAGATQASAGARQISGGTSRAKSGTARLLEGLDDAYDGARRLTRGAGSARRGSERLAAGNDRLSDELNGRLAPGADQLARELRRGQAQLQALRLPAQVTERELNNAFQTLNSMTIGKTDPLFGQALQQVGTALGAATGRNPLTGEVVFGGYQGLDNSIARAADEAGRAADGADQIATGARDAADGAEDLSAGASDLASGLRRLERGNRQLQSGIGRMRQEVAASASGLDRLVAGASRLSRGATRIAAGSRELSGGLGQIQAGQRRLAGGLQSGARQSAPLESGLGGAATEVGTVRDQLVGRTGPFRELRNLDELNRRSPGFFRSGYVTVAALEGAPRFQRESSLFLVDSRRGGDVARVMVLPDVPTNDPRTARVVDDVTDVTRDFSENGGPTAAVGGAASQLVDFDRATSDRIPLLVIGIAIVTYLMLVPILRSLLLPAIAVGLNLVTVAVGFGVLTLLFVGDNPPLGGAGALDVISVAGIFAITFALSIDYQVFLLTRMREEFVRTQSNDAAINFGIEKTARVVTGAAAIMVAVFLAFALQEFVIIRQFGVGLAVAVLIDATIVRLALLPSLMHLFGLNTWWIPNWLDERLPLLDVEGSEFEHESEQLQPRPAPAG